ncbi:MAG: hypothetical protein IJ861_06225 [Clostridia bacterium]|nr:hypothetical protein [Clostridia bacterium]
MQLCDFISNEDIKNELSEAMSSGTLPHAIIIDGAKGTGKRTLATIIAQYGVCLADNGRPCGVCSGCLKAIHGSHPDIFIADGNHSGELAVNVIRQIRSDAYIKPNEAPAKVFMLLNCDKMLAPAQNAFLKVLEEPPANVMFVMTVTSANMLLETVRSRSRIYSLFPADPKQAAEFAAQKFPDKPYEELLRAAGLCGGNIGQTIQLIESGGEEAKILAEEIFASMQKSSEYELLVRTNQLTKDRAFAAAVLDNMLEISAECLKAAVGAETNSEIAVQIARKMTKKKIYAMAETIRNACGILNTNVNLNFFGTWLCAVLKA